MISGAAAAAVRQDFKNQREKEKKQEQKNTLYSHQKQRLHWNFPLSK